MDIAQPLGRQGVRRVDSKRLLEGCDRVVGFSELEQVFRETAVIFRPLGIDRDRPGVVLARRVKFFHIIVQVAEVVVSFGVIGIRLDPFLKSRDGSLRVAFTEP